jgi:glyoxylase-like metal-dependent hydrolase (beta-lactamase superfamily II)
MTKTVTQISLGQVNVFLVRGQAGCVLVDTGNPDYADVILEKLKEHGVAPDDVCLILITHGHTDHFGSAAELQERTGALVAVHALDADAMRRGINPPDSFQPTGRLLTLLMRIPVVQRLLDSNRAPPCEPNILFAGEETRLDEYGVAGRVIHTPGHTHGSVSVLLDSGEAIIGDAVMTKMMGLIRKPGHPFIAWDLAQNRDSVRQLLVHSPHTICVGHGGPFAAEDVFRLVAE